MNISTGKDNLNKKFNKWLKINYKDDDIEYYNEVIKGLWDWLQLFPKSNRKLSSNIFFKYRQYIIDKNKNKTIINKKIKALILYGKFLEQENKITNPAKKITLISTDEKTTPSPKKSIIQEFSIFLSEEKLTKNSIKNYIQDVEQFFAWFHQYQKGIEINLFTPQIINFYRQYLQFELNFAPASIERKISALKKFFKWAVDKGIFIQNPFNKNTAKKTYGELAPTINIHKKTDDLKNFFIKYKNIINTTIILFLIFLAIFRPWNFFDKKISDQAILEIDSKDQINKSNNTPLWKIKINGKMFTSTGEKIPKNSEVKFSIYGSQYNQVPIWTSDPILISSDPDGNIKTEIGSNINNKIPIDLYFQYQELYVGGSIHGEDLFPRIKISTAANNNNAWKVANFIPSKNPKELNIPVINKDGNIKLNTENTTIKNDQGGLSLEGDSINIVVPYSSNKDLTLSALGGGNINILSNNIANDSIKISNGQQISGALLSLELTSDFNTANLLDLRSGETPISKFSVDSWGNLNLSGNITGIPDLLLKDNRSEIMLSDAQHVTLPTTSKSIIGAISEVYHVATRSSIWVEDNSYINPKEGKFIKIYESTSKNDNFLQITNNSIANAISNITINPTNSLILNANTIDTSSQTTNIDIIGNKDNALSFEGDLLTLNTNDSSITINGIAKFGDGGNTEYIKFDDYGNLLFYGNNSSNITGSPDTSLNISSGNSQSLNIIGNNGINLNTGNNIFDINAPTIDISSQSTNITLKDNTIGSFSIFSETNKYLQIDTINNNEALYLGNSDYDLDINYRGNGDITQTGIGQITFNGNINANNGIDITGDLNLTNSNNIIFNNSTTLRDASSSIDSGAYFIGINSDSISHSTNNNIQNVIEDIDTAISNIDSGGSGLWISGTYGDYDDNNPIIIGNDNDFTYFNEAIGDLKISNNFEVINDGYIGNNIYIGASTSNTETLDNGNFNVNGDDMFVAGDAGIEGNIYTDGSLIIGNEILTINATNGISKTTGDLNFITQNGFSYTIGNTSGDNFSIGDNLFTLEGDTGYLGIGTNTPTTTLDIQSNNPGSIISMFTNTDTTNTSSDGIAIDISETSNNTNHVYIDFLQNGTSIGGIRNNGSGSIQYSTSGVDFAEYFPKDINHSGDVGDVMCLNKYNTTTPCNKDNESTQLGVVSKNSGFTGGVSNDTNILIGLIGQIPTKVSSLGGDIKSGDPITSSTIPGISQKSNNTGTIIAKALDSFEPNDDICSSVTSIDQIIWPEDDGRNPTKPCFKLPDGTYIGKIMTFVKVSWYDPNAYLTSSGEIYLENETYNGLLKDININKIMSLSHKVQSINNQIINQVGVFKDIITGSIKTSLIVTKNLIANTIITEKIKVKNKIISPLAEFDQLNINGENIENKIIKNENTILSQKNKLNQLETKINTISNDKTSTNSTTFSKIVYDKLYLKEATISSSFFTDNLNTKTASVSNHLLANNISSNNIMSNTARFKLLEAEKIKVKNIEGIEAKIGNIISQQNSTQNLEIKKNKNYSETEKDQDKNWQQKLDKITEQLDTLNIASTSALWALDTNINNDKDFDVNSIDANIGMFNTFLSVLGSASIVNLEVTNSLVVNDNLHINQNSISTINGQENTLFLQKSGIGAVNILAGAITIEENGDLHVNGDLYLAGNLYIDQNIYTKNINTDNAHINKSLFADILEVNNILLDNNDLKTTIATHSSQIANLNNQYQNMFDSSGSATLKKIVIAGAQPASPSSNFIKNTLTSNATAGTAYINKGENQIQIINPNIEEKSLIYITPTSDTENKVLYIKNKHIDNDISYFTIGINEYTNKNIYFNWWIIN